MLEILGRKEIITFLILVSRISLGNGKNPSIILVLLLFISRLQIRYLLSEIKVLTIIVFDENVQVIASLSFSLSIFLTRSN